MKFSAVSSERQICSTPIRLQGLLDSSSVW